MNGESVNFALEAAFSALKNQVDAHLQAGLPRLLNYLWQPLVPFLLTPTPAIGLIAARPEKPYCQAESMAPQSMTLLPFSSHGSTVAKKPCYFQSPYSMQLYPLQVIEQKKQYEDNKTYLSVVLKNNNLQRSVCVQEGLQFAVSGNYELAVAYWQQLCRCAIIHAHIERGQSACTLTMPNQKNHPFQRTFPALLQYGLAPATLLLVSIQLKTPLTILAGGTLQLLFEWPEILDAQQLNTDQIQLIPNSTWICNQYETDAVPIRQPQHTDTHWVQPLQPDVSVGEMLSVASIQGMSATLKQAIPAALTAYPKASQSQVSYYAFYEGERLGLQLAGDLSVIEWLSISVWAHQGDRPFTELLPGKVAVDLLENPVGWQWETLTRFTLCQKNMRLPSRYTDLSWLSAPLQLFQTEAALREYLELFALKAPGLLKKLTAIEQVRCEQIQVFQQGMLQLQLILDWQLDLRAFENNWDCQLFLQAVYWQLLPLVPYAYHLKFQLRASGLHRVWQWPS